jgi:hypothetical protein
MTAIKDLQAFGGQQLTISDWLGRAGSNRVATIFYRHTPNEHLCFKSQHDPEEPLTQPQIEKLKRDENGYVMSYSDYLSRF